MTKFHTKATALIATIASASALSMVDPSAARADMAGGPARKYYGGAGVGRFTLDDGDWECLYDMFLVERIQGKPKTQSGLFVPQDDLPTLHLLHGIMYY